MLLPSTSSLFSAGRRLGATVFSSAVSLSSKHSLRSLATTSNVFKTNDKSYNDGGNSILTTKTHLYSIHLNNQSRKHIFIQNRTITNSKTHFGMSDEMRRFGPGTPGKRHRVSTSRKGLWPGRPRWHLTVGKRRTRSGRCAITGKIVVRHQGGGHKRLYRLVSFKRREIFGEFEVVRLEYDPNRSTRIALVKSTGQVGPIRLSTAAEITSSFDFNEADDPELALLQRELKEQEIGEKLALPTSSIDMDQTDRTKNIDPVKKPNILQHVNVETLKTTDRSNHETRLTAERVRSLQYQVDLQNIPIPRPVGEYRYVLAPYGAEEGMKWVTGPHAQIVPGNSLPLKYIPQGTQVFNVELRPQSGTQIVRSAGTSAFVMDTTTDYRGRSLVLLRLPSFEQRWFHGDCYATIGKASNINHRLRMLGKAGASRWLGIRPTVRGAAMNACDHPHGGKNKGKGGRPLKNWKWKPIGSRLAGPPTRKKNKESDRFILKGARKERRRRAGFKG